MGEEGDLHNLVVNCRLSEIAGKFSLRHASQAVELVAGLVLEARVAV